MTNFAASTLRPGLLVSLRTSIKGNVSYTSTDIERERLTADGQLRAKWETERTISDPDEFARAQKVQSKMGSLIRGICAHSAFGLLCPNDKAEQLDQAVAEAQRLAAEFNNSATVTRVRINVIAGRIAQDDVEAQRALNSEVRDLIAAMEEGVRKSDPKAIRENASALKQLGQMLTPAAQARVQLAIDAVRSTARRIVAAGEAAAKEVDRSALQRLAEARTAFLDLDAAQDVQAPVVTSRAIDFEPEAAAAAPAVTQEAAPIDMDEVTVANVRAYDAPARALDIEESTPEERAETYGTNVEDERNADQDAAERAREPDSQTRQLMDAFNPPQLSLI